MEWKKELDKLWMEEEHTLKLADMIRFIEKVEREAKVNGKKEVIDMWIKNMKPLVKEMDKMCLDNIAQLKGGEDE